MAELKKMLRTCPKGHNYYKSSNCPTCPVCEAERKPKEGFLSRLGAPARRALENHEITTLKKLSKYSEAEVLGMHGIGKTTIPILKASLAEAGLGFRKS
ncbi:MAG: RNA polymerase alpha subunit C-terminal domain-containing protein [Bacteroidetes bacterium]|nr:RNA polymerase alpha subunit C-terminal domain-containing protein [Bacteroidota bacterium]MBS1609280.1 RNA polymerase alpha subunit C-terminal domain-containing protein [Bacteroidota bacterium]